MEMPHSMRKVQAARNAERRICRDGVKSGGLIPSHLETLFKEMHEKGDEFATQRWAWENGRGKRFGSFEDTIVIIDPVSFEIQLKVKGRRKPSEDKVLAIDAFASQHAVAYMSNRHRTFTIDVDGVGGKLELTQALLEESVEATIMVEVHDVSWPKCTPGRVTACTDSIPGRDIVLVDSRREALTFNDSGLIKFSRDVVSVELSGKLELIWRLNTKVKL
ncbi:hypothetical protein PR202_ga09259 [Eleusine coracana subsp. coracana]|uniref:DUF6598 domain-containing protein n=1 Tax=Eleusine coracana subsp. coracana TaxID=191504 RepID=A0AAV5C4M9_ELECO|nr:hypothetical protein PR202_ga09259 [Eleusine coracana subsp. coracana]